MTEEKRDYDDLPRAEIIENIDLSDGSSVLVLQANIGDQAQRFALPIDALTRDDMTGPAVVSDLRRIRVGLESVARNQQNQIDATNLQTGELIRRLDALLTVLRNQDQ